MLIQISGKSNDLHQRITPEEVRLWSKWLTEKVAPGVTVQVEEGQEEPVLVSGVDCPDDGLDMYWALFRSWVTSE